MYEKTFWLSAIRKIIVAITVWALCFIALFFNQKTLRDFFSVRFFGNPFVVSFDISDLSRLEKLSWRHVKTVTVPEQAHQGLYPCTWDISESYEGFPIIYKKNVHNSCEPSFWYINDREYMKNILFWVAASGLLTTFGGVVLWGIPFLRKIWPYRSSSRGSRAKSREI
jgi:hypothetical protein